MSFDALIVDMPQEMYQDALHFYREARKNQTNVNPDPFVTWRNLRAAILFSFAAIESCINHFIDEHVDRNRRTMSSRDIDRWTEKDKYMSINTKLNEGVVLFGGERLDKDRALWKDYEELKALRDALVHFKVSNHLFYDTDELTKKVQKGIATSSEVVKQIILSHPNNPGYPKTYDKVP